jgi:hypothetical protein
MALVLQFGRGLVMLCLSPRGTNKDSLGPGEHPIGPQVHAEEPPSADVTNLGRNAAGRHRGVIALRGRRRSERRRGRGYDRM